jgi:hypothetical protein
VLLDSSRIAAVCVARWVQRISANSSSMQSATIVRATDVRFTVVVASRMIAEIGCDGWWWWPGGGVVAESASRNSSGPDRGFANSGSLCFVAAKLIVAAGGVEATRGKVGSGEGKGRAGVGRRLGIPVRGGRMWPAARAAGLDVKNAARIWFRDSGLRLLMAAGLRRPGPRFQGAR